MLKGKMRKASFVLLAVTFSVFVFYLSATAQVSTYKPEQSGAVIAGNVSEEIEPGQNIDMYGRYFPTVDAQSRSGEIGIVESRAQYVNKIKLFDKLPLKFIVSDRYMGIENSTSVYLPAHLFGVSAGIEATFPFFNMDNSYFRVGVYPSFYGDKYDFDSSSFRIPSNFMAIFIPNDRWTFVVGVAVTPDFETEAFPILGFIYTPNDKLSFNLLPLRPNVSYKINDNLTTFIEGGFSGLEFEVDKPEQENAVLRYKEMHLGAGITYKFNKYIQATFAGGGVFDRVIKYKNVNLGKVSVENGAYSELRVNINF